MKRREAVAGLASVGLLGGGVALWRRTSITPAAPDETEETEEDSSGEPEFELETIDAGESEAGTIPVPTDGVLLLNFTSPSCGTCQRLMPPLEDAVAELTQSYADVLTVVSVTAPFPEDDLREWWAEHNADWSLGFDPRGRLSTWYRITGYPVLAAVDSDGELRWDDDGVVDTNVIVRNLEPILEEAATADGEDERDVGSAEHSGNSSTEERADDGETDAETAQ
ncbi:TlpA family protein disulfide reductase [Natrarchaeobaculum sulfurireducens]|uniref:Thiol-disulfide isomerase n=1 Tax=Natrarchaeobaculum sulfurireducens TaxID=2044521 RepID=A0A346PHF7_9EURY|nr:TlpA disulfide reductase family protein [Natrarchaeobaculum sulfurireducens]AXR78952.1 Thiol-disulfide isomerase [Natrarchaeobaculum sulfurireducens]